MRFYGLQQPRKNMQRSHVFIAPSISPDFPAGCFFGTLIKKEILISNEKETGEAATCLIPSMLQTEQDRLLGFMC